jgi:hypothetical protein
VGSKERGGASAVLAILVTVVEVLNNSSTACMYDTHSKPCHSISGCDPILHNGACFRNPSSKDHTSIKESEYTSI